MDDEQHKPPTDQDAEGWLEVVQSLWRIEARLNSALHPSTDQPARDEHPRGPRGPQVTPQQAQVAG